MATNLFYLDLRNRKEDGTPRLFPGMKPSVLRESGSVQLALVLGGFQKGGTLRPGSLTIPFAPGSDGPIIRDGDKVYAAEFVPLGANDKTTVMRRLLDEPAAASYVLLRTGIKPDPFGGILADLQSIGGVGSGLRLCDHGSVSFHFGTGVQATAVATVKDADFGKVAAEQVAALVVNRSGLLGGMLLYTYVLWKLVDDSVVLARDIDGVICRVVRQKGRVSVVDASGYQDYADSLFARA